MKTLLDLSQELNVPKQKIYRYIKKHIIDVHHETGVMYIDETAETILKQAFNQNKPYHSNTFDVHHEAHQITSNDTVLMQFEEIINILKLQLQEKNKQINDLLEQLSSERQHNREQSDKLVQLADQAQRLQLAQLSLSDSKLLSDKLEKKHHWWQRKEKGE